MTSALGRCLFAGLLISAIFLLAAPAEPAPQPSGASIVFKPDCKDDLACASWAAFRAQHPFPIQTIAGTVSAGHLILLITEPAPVMSKADFMRLVQKTFGSDLESYQERRWKIGIDGWAEDVILSVHWAGKPASYAAILKDGATRDRLALLYRDLFGTVYGATLEDAAASYEKAARAAAPNLTPRPDELSHWLNDGSRTWLPVANSGAPEAFSALTGRGASGAFMSSDYRLVLYLLPKAALEDARRDAQSIEPYRVGFRKFAVASDAVVGSIQAGDVLAIVARARAVPEGALPPLRFETFKLLAGEGANELKQSYERTTLLAGKLLQGEYEGRDWAPIFLSEDLIDTEFGALLNITDQMLKSWTEGGHIQYAYFNYPLRPAPGAFVFGAKPLSNIVLEEAGPGARNVQVLFNWNTSGLAVQTKLDSATLFVPRQTGALPVTYGSDLGGGMQTHQPALIAREDHAYDYFAARKDPNLARVLSYDLIYQSLRAAAQTDASDPSNEDPIIKPREKSMQVMQDAATRLLKLAAAKPQRPDPGQLKKGDRKDLLGYIAQSNAHESLAAFAAQYPDLAGDTEGLARLLIDRSAGNRLLQKKLAELKADPSITTVKQVRAALLNYREGIEDVSRLGTSLRHYAPYLVDIDAVRRDYLEANAAEPEGRIKTPSIVLSWDTYDQGVGGHNLTAKATQLKLDANVQGITITQGDFGTVVTANPRYAKALDAHATDVSRMVEHGQVNDPAVIQKFLEQPVLPERAIETGLEQTAPADPLRIAGYTAPAAESSGVLRERGLAMMRETGADAAVLRDADGYYLLADVNRSKGINEPRCCSRYGDVVSLRDRLLAIKQQTQGNARVVFSGNESPVHVDAIARSVGLGKDADATLDTLAGGIGGKPPGPPSDFNFIPDPEAPRPGPGGDDGTYFTGRGDDGNSYVVLVGDSRPAAHAEAARPRNFADVHLTVLDGEAARAAAHAAGPSRFIELRFGGEREPTAAIAAEFDPAKAQVGRKLLDDAVHDALQTRQQSLVVFQARLKAFIKSRKDGGAAAIRNLKTYVRAGQLKFYIAGNDRKPIPAG